MLKSKRYEFAFKKIPRHQNRNTNMRISGKEKRILGVVKENNIPVLWREEKQFTGICNENIFQRAFEEGFL